ncbi:Putative F-box protein At2g39415 [Linum perenne]
MEDEEEDPFQKLPEELLTKITASLPLQAAARTSLISRRWRYAWRKTPNPHFDGNKTTKFRSDGYPISYFDSLHHFFNWIDQTIAEHENLGITDQSDLRIESLGLNFSSDEETHNGWIELRRSESDDSVLIGGYRVVSFLSSSTMNRSLSDLLKRRPNLLRKLTLRNCEMEILESQLLSGGGGGGFRSLESVVIQCGGKLLHLEFVSRLIGSVPSLKCITLEDCDLRIGDGLSVEGSNIKLKLVRCRLN